MTTGRIVSPEFAFTAVLRQAHTATSQAKGTITKTEAEKALHQLEGHPSADAAERARIVQSFLDGKEGAALSPKAKDVLVDFVKSQSAQGGGQKSTELKAAAAKDAKSADKLLDQARADVSKLMAKGMVGKTELASVSTALDGALKSVAEARKNLTGLLKVADHAAKTADELLKTAGGELKQAKEDLGALLAKGKSTGVTKAQLAEVSQWLNAPKTELATAQRELGDGGLGPHRTLKYPSDGEDAGGGGNTGPIFRTMKAPSDSEDAGGGPLIHPPKPSAIKQDRLDTMKQVFKVAEQAGRVQWHNSMPLGQRFESAFLSRENHPDGFSFSTMVPVGALTPTAPKADPNGVNTFWIQRTGGIAGMTQYAGPFDFPQKAILPRR